MKRTGGFTLIELMVVVGLMILVGSIVVSGAFGMTRGSSYTAAQNLVYNTLQMARQKACTDGKRVIVAFIPPPKVDRYEDNTFTAIEATGTITEEVTGNVLMDRCANLAKYSEGGRQSSGSSTNTVWNLRTGASFSGFKVKADYQIDPAKPIPGASGKFTYKVTQITPKSGFDKKMWSKGDPYGFQIVPIQSLPRGFKLSFGTSGTSPNNGNSMMLIVFEPDGTGYSAELPKNGVSTGIRKKSESVKLFLYEEINKSDEKKAVTINVNNGIVSVEGAKK